MKLFWNQSIYFSFFLTSLGNNWEMEKDSILNQLGPDISYFEGKVLLIVNVASLCGFTPQYKGLQALYDLYRDKGFEVLGFPCNDFGGQEPGDSEEILSFCQTQFKINFHLFEKVKILGSETHPLYKRLLDKGLPVEIEGGIKSFLFHIVKPVIYRIKGMPTPPPNGVDWNFHKFVISRKGKPTGHFSSDVKPENPILIKRIELELGCRE